MVFLAETLPHTGWDQARVEHGLELVVWREQVDVGWPIS